jgi:hypothetical protein
MLRPSSSIAPTSDGPVIFFKVLVIIVPLVVVFLKQRESFSVFTAINVPSSDIRVITGRWQAGEHSQTPIRMCR